MELSIQVMKLGFKEKGRIFYFNILGATKIGKLNYTAILISAKFTCDVRLVLILDIFT
jgi:hypothetical protein